MLGSDITGATSDTTYVDHLNIKNVPIGTTTKSLAIDANGNVIDGSGNGSFSDRTTQTGTASSANIVTFDTTDISSGVTVVSTTQLTVSNTGTYNIQFSAQLAISDDNPGAYVEVWLSNNGTPVPFSNRYITVEWTGKYYFASWNWFSQSTTGGYFEIMWSPSDANIQLVTIGATGWSPDVPSVIATVNKIT